jgi:hypothetical protein
MKRALLVAALVVLAAPLRADDAPAPAPVTDPAQVAAHYREVAARPEFHDDSGSALNPQVEDLLSTWFKSLGARVGEFRYSSRMPAFESMLMSIMVVVALALLGYVVMRLTRSYRRRWDEEKPATPGPRNLPPPEFYDEEIAQAVAAQDWHRAWLATWRQFLARLEHRRLVEADRTRTNREYLGQLRGQPLPATGLALVAAMVEAYDRSIYGRALIAEGDWTRFRQQVEEAALLLHLDDRRAPLPATTGAAA